MKLLVHPAFLSVFFSWIIAGLIKYVVAMSENRSTASFVNELMRTGGMPSAHSATVTAVTLSVFFIEGFSTLFFVSAVFSILIIRDSYGVRWSVGEQAKVINKLIAHDCMHEKVKVIMGHTVSQANFGILLGIIITLLVHMTM